MRNTIFASLTVCAAIFGEVTAVNESHMSMPMSVRPSDLDKRAHRFLADGQGDQVEAKRPHVRVAQGDEAQAKRPHVI